MAQQPFLLDLDRFSFQFLDHLYSREDSFSGGSAGRKAATCTHRTAETQNESTQTSMPQVGFEPTIPAFQWAKIVHSLHRAATMIGVCNVDLYIFPLYRTNTYQVDGAKKLASENFI
jgi:hypothetical protein